MDLSGRWSINDSFELNAAVANVFDRIAPLDPTTYGAVNYNPMHFSGALGLPSKARAPARAFVFLALAGVFTATRLPCPRGITAAGDLHGRNIATAGPARVARTGGRLDGRCWHLLLATERRAQRRPGRRTDRLGGEWRRHADAGLRVPGAGQPPAGPGYRHLRVCARGLRQLHRFLCGVGLLGRLRAWQRQLLRADLQWPRPLHAGLRRRQHAGRGRSGVRAAVDRTSTGAAWPAHRGHRQWPGDRGQTAADRAVPGARGRRIPPRCVPRGFPRHACTRRPRPAAARHDAGHRVGVHRHRGRKHLLVPCGKTLGRRQGHRDRLHHRPAAAGAGERPVHGRDDPAGTGQAAEPVDGAGTGACGRSLGRGADQRRPADLPARCPALLGPAVRRNHVRRGQGPHHAGVPPQGERQPGAGQRPLADQHLRTGLPGDHLLHLR
ncbi:hypothetical protein G6F24_013268 [Rhizopus arrhizus]|nr:hypothetical protein G6F24_013268 [Rhizopus arrhizus]